MKNTVIILSILSIMFGCGLESEFSLPNDQKVDKELIGVWGSKEDKEIVAIEKDSGKTYKLTIIEKGKDPGPDDSVISFSTQIKGYNIMNISEKEKDGKVVNTFWGYEVVRDRLQFRAVSDKLIDKEFSSRQELLSFFNQHIEEEGFFEPTEYLYRL